MTDTKKEIVRWFKSPSQVGEIRLLPSDIGDNVLIRKPKMAYAGGHGSCHEFSVVSVLKARTRTINRNQTWGLPEGVTETYEIDTPKLVYQYDFNSLAAGLMRNVGYLYQIISEEGSLSETLKGVLPFKLRPHVYVDAYMCLMNKTHDSPRVLNNVFWDSSFRDDGRPLAQQMLEESFPEDVVRQQRILNENYENYFEIDKKPAGIFISSNSRVLAKAKLSVFPGKKYVIGFAWLVKNRWWAYTKEGVFMRFYPEQLKII